MTPGSDDTSSSDRADGSTDGHTERATAPEGPTGSSRPSGTSRRLLQIADVAAYAVIVTVIVVVVATAISFGIGLGWIGTKYLLFVGGFVLLGVAAIGLRPQAAWKDDDTDEESPTGREEPRLQVVVQRVPPFRRHTLAPSDQVSSAAKLAVASLLTLAVSFLMEAWLGV